MAQETEKFIFYYAGLSSDWRTNKWRVNCKKCGKTFYPLTTIFAYQIVQCPKCEQEEEVNYNNFEE